MYPLKFQPVYQERMWGGRSLRALLGKNVGRELERMKVGESWELADLPSGTVKGDSAGAAADGSLSSMVANGAWAGRSLRELLADEELRSGIMGTTALHRGHFPLLVKFLDARENLSVQVHPDAAHCAAHSEAHLKNEAWYIVHAEPGAKIYKGLKAGVTREQFRKGLETGEVAPLLHAVPVRAGDCHYLPSGMVHALGAGIVAAEVQTPSDTTFRVFDWNRLGPDGRPRKLRVEEALGCMTFDDAPAASGKDEAPAGQLAACAHFTIERAELAGGTDREIIPGEPVIWIMLEGQGVITCDRGGPTALTRGDTILLPAELENGRIKAVAAARWLEVRIPAAQIVKGGA